MGVQVQEVVREVKVPQVQMVEKVVNVPEMQTVERIVEVPQIQVVEIEKEVALPAITVAGSPVTTYNAAQTYSSPQNYISSLPAASPTTFTYGVSSAVGANPTTFTYGASSTVGANPTTFTYGASSTAMSPTSYQMQGQVATNNPTVTYPTSFPHATYQAPTVYHSPITYQAPMSYTAPSYVQAGTSPAGATFDMLDQNHDGVISREEFSAAAQ